MQIAIFALAGMLGLVVLAMIAISLTAKPTPASANSPDDVVLAQLPLPAASELTPRMMLDLSSYWEAPVVVRPRASQRPLLEILVGLIPAELPTLVLRNPQDPEESMSFLIESDAAEAWLHQLRHLQKGGRTSFVNALADGGGDAGKIGRALDGQTVDSPTWREEVAGLVPQLSLELERCADRDRALMINYRGSMNREDLGLRRPPLMIKVRRVASVSEEELRGQLEADAFETRDLRMLPMAPTWAPLLLVLLRAADDDLGVVELASAKGDDSALGLAQLIPADVVPAALELVNAYKGERSQALATSLAELGETHAEELKIVLETGDLDPELDPSPELHAALLVHVLGSILEEAAKAGEAVVITHEPVTLEQLQVAREQAAQPSEEGDRDLAEGSNLVPLLEVFMARVPAGSLERPGTVAFRGARSFPLSTLQVDPGTFLQVLADAGGQLSAQIVLGEEGLLIAVGRERVEDSVQGLEHSLGEGRSEYVGVLAESFAEEGASAEAIEERLTGGWKPGPPNPVFDAVRLLEPLRAACVAAQGAEEDVVLMTRYCSAREVIRNLQNAPPPGGKPLAWCLELQLITARTPLGGQEDLNAETMLRAFMSESVSVPLPSARQVLYMTLAALCSVVESGEVPVAPLGETEMLFMTRADEVADLIAALEAALGEKQETFVATLVEMEVEDEPINGDPCAGADRIREVLEAGELVGEPTPSLEAASVVKPLLAKAKQALEHGDSLQLLYRMCQFTEEG